MKQKLLVLLIISIFFISGCGDGLPKNLYIKLDKSTTIEYETFKNNLFQIDIPKDWKVEIAITDNEHYTFKIYNPNDENYVFFFSIRNDGFLKTSKAKNLYVKEKPDASSSKLPSLEDRTSRYYYSVWNVISSVNSTKAFSFPIFDNLTNVEIIGNTNDNNDIITGDVTSPSGKTLKGIFIAKLVDTGTNYVKNQEGVQIDIGFVSVYDTIFFLSPKDNFINWEPVYIKMLNTLTFSKEYTSSLTDELILKSVNTYSDLGTQINKSWKKRNQENAIKEEKNIDKKLGYERVYDKKTGNIYKVKNGFTLSYDGNRYEMITDDMYEKPITGYIKEKSKN